MESMSKRMPKYWINPNFRLNFPSFSVEWHLCDASDLELDVLYNRQERLVYGNGNNCVHMIVREGNSGLDLLYTKETKFENVRIQKWLRVTIRDHIVLRAKDVLPKRMHELESQHGLYANGLAVKKLRKGILGQCTHSNYIYLSPIIVIFPKRLMDVVILHEMAHLKHHHHRKSFWEYLSLLIGEDAKQQNEIQDMAVSKYWDFYLFLMKQ
jgi:predicted metal-dependent hydrolase